MATDLKAFQARLNSDKAFRFDFLKDPVKALKAAGLILPSAAKIRLKELVAQLKRKKRFDPDDGIEIQLTIEPEEH